MHDLAFDKLAVRASLYAAMCDTARCCVDARTYLYLHDMMCVVVLLLIAAHVLLLRLSGDDGTPSRLM
jgi:hypothetical protein